MKRVTRNRARVSYYEPEEPSFDDYIFCWSCGDYVYEYCSIHGPLLVIPDEEVSTPTGFPAIVPRAALTVPRVFLHLAPSTIPDAGIGVFCTLTLPAGVRFGPYRGLKTDQPSSTYCWQIFDRDRKPAHVLDARDPNKSNWMRYVNCSRHHSEQNLVAYQYRGQLYYRTIRIVPRFTELLVFYGSTFASQLDIDVRWYHAPAYAHILVNAENGAQESQSLKVNEDASTVDEEDNLQNSISHEFNCETDVGSSESIVVNLKDLREEYVDKIEENSKGQHDNYVCNYCGQSFNEKTAIIDHIATHSAVNNAGNIIVSKTKVLKYSCSTCNSKFATKSDLINHDIKIHDSKIKYKVCTKCDYKTSHSNNFKRHMETHSDNRIPGYKCDICSYTAFTNTGLKRHKNKHTQGKIYSCQTCGIKFNNKIRLTIHSKIHEADRLYPCTYCEYRARCNYDLKRHTTVHSESKPFKCMICSKCFMRRYSLTRHTKLHGDN